VPKHFGAFDQNLMTEWHVRYGGRGVMIYWHVERGSVCIHSRLRRCSSSEVAAMIEGVLRHDTGMEVERQYVDSHGQSEVAFAFCRMLGFQLLPRLKAISAQRLYLPETGDAASYPNLTCILARQIDWALVEQQYDEFVRYTTAMAERTADPEAILRRFTRGNGQHPTYKALAELGKTVKTIFLCRYLGDEALRREIHEGLNVVETWNSVNGFIFFGKGGEVASNRLDDQEVSVHALHLLQYLLGVREYADATARAGRIRVDGAHDASGPARPDPAPVGPRQPIRRLRLGHGNPARPRCQEGCVNEVASLRSWSIEAIR